MLIHIEISFSLDQGNFNCPWNITCLNKQEKKLNLRRPLHRKLRIRLFFDVFKVKESSFFKSDLTDPPLIFYAHLLENTNLSPSSFHFSAGFRSRSCFESDGFIAYSNEWDWREKTMLIHINQPLITSFYIKM